MWNLAQKNGGNCAKRAMALGIRKSECGMRKTELKFRDSGIEKLRN
jgi:hypothetical protein